MELKTIITQYQSPMKAIDIVKRTKIALLVGIAGAGKDSIKKGLLVRDGFQDIVSHTTRSPRSNNGAHEIEGVDYHFIDDTTAAKMAKSKEFIETKFVHGTVYGTSIAAVKQAHDLGKIAITDIDVQGVDEYKKISANVIAIFILPPSYETWLVRLGSRYATNDEFKAEFPKRQASAVKELTHALEVPFYHFIINEDLGKAIEIADEIAHKPDVFHRKDDEARLAARDLLEAIQKNS